jgi:hypothetical protein
MNERREGKGKAEGRAREERGKREWEKQREDRGKNEGGEREESGKSLNMLDFFPTLSSLCLPSAFPFVFPYAIRSSARRELSGIVFRFMGIRR